MKKLFLLVFVLVVLGLILQANQTRKNIITKISQVRATEILEIKATQNLDQQVTLYKKLIGRVGPEKAQDELLGSGLSFDGQTHLLNHAVGDWLYEKYKTAGLVKCRDYFLSSCYHGFVIYAVADGGFEALRDVMAKCWESGEHVAVQCSHAIGHGFLAWAGYSNLIEALKDCDKLATQSQRFPLYNCHDGVFMENIWAVHETGRPSKDRWIKDSDHVYPCNDSRIPQQYINACWSNQPMRMYQMFGGDLVRAGNVCLGLTNTTYQKTCFDGLARQIHPLTKGSATEVFRLCSLMPKEWVDPCVISITRAEFSVGGKELPFELCKKISRNSQKSCYEGLGNIIWSYTIKNQEEREILCNKIPPSWQQKCTNQQ